MHSGSASYRLTTSGSVHIHACGDFSPLNLRLNEPNVRFSSNAGLCLSPATAANALPSTFAAPTPEFRLGLPHTTSPAYPSSLRLTQALTASDPMLCPKSTTGSSGYSLCASCVTFLTSSTSPLHPPSMKCPRSAAVPTDSPCPLWSCITLANPFPARNSMNPAYLSLCSHIPCTSCTTPRAPSSGSHVITPI